MSIHIHLYDCNCVFCSSDFPLNFVQTHNDGGSCTQSTTAKQPEDETYQLDDDEEDDEEDNDEEDDKNVNEPKPKERKKLFGFLIDNHSICVL